MAVKFLNGVDVVGSMNIVASDVPNLDASKITSGTMSAARMPDISGTYLTTSAKAADSNLLDGYNSSTSPTANTVAVRNANGDIAAREITLSSALITATPTVLVSMYPTTNQLVRTTPAAVAASLNLSGTNTGDQDLSGYLTTSGKAADSELLDGINSTSFLRSDANDTHGGTLALTNITAAAGSINNTKGSYLHIGSWGAGRTAADAVLVNTAYRSDILSYNRDFTIGSTTRSFNGSSNVSWSLAEIGAEAAGAAAAVDARIDAEVLPAIPTVPTTVSSFTNDSNYIAIGSTVASSASWANATKFASAGDIATTTAGNHSLQVYSDINNDAFMAFHISSDHAVYFGLENSSNRLHTGGWSKGANKYQIFDTRDFSVADVGLGITAHGWGNHASAQYATEAWVGEQNYATDDAIGNAISNLIDSSPANLDTLNELAAALGDDANFSTTVTNSIATKLPLAGGTATGTIAAPSFDATTEVTVGPWAIRHNTGTGRLEFVLS